MHSLGRDFASEFEAKCALDSTNATAGGSGDATAANGVTLDQQGLATRYQSMAFVINAKAALTATKGITVAAKVQDSDNGSDWEDLVASTTVIDLESEAGGTVRGTGKVGVDLTKGRQ